MESEKIMAVTTYPAAVGGHRERRAAKQHYVRGAADKAASLMG